ncbi:MAG: hypothetical protein EBR23_11680 [Planctomycetia bacterium]|nr:hypothetical protein [Planctomycetia bacterium]
MHLLLASFISGGVGLPWPGGGHWLRTTPRNSPLPSWYSVAASSPPFSQQIRTRPWLRPSPGTGNCTAISRSPMVVGTSQCSTFEPDSRGFIGGSVSIVRVLPFWPKLQTWPPDPACCCRTTTIVHSGLSNSGVIGRISICRPANDTTGWLPAVGCRGTNRGARSGATAKRSNLFWERSVQTCAVPANSGSPEDRPAESLTPESARSQSRRSGQAASGWPSPRIACARPVAAVAINPRQKMAATIRDRRMHVMSDGLRCQAITVQPRPASIHKSVARCWAAAHRRPGHGC